MFELFKDKSAKLQDSHADTQRAEDDSIPGTEIRYSPTLVDELKDDHQKLFAAYLSIKENFDRHDFSAVSQQLNDFRFNLHNHLITENVRLYIYLGSITRHDKEKSEMVHSFRHEMEGIGKTAIRLLKKYEALNINRELAEHFAQDWAAIGAILTERVNKEESVLYPLYTSFC